MITPHGQMTVNLHSLLINEQAKTAIDKALSTYPLYTGKKNYDLIPSREELNERLINYYKYREIGFETIGRFLDELENTMCEIMPYYNELYKTVETMADLENPFDNVDFVETFEEQRTEKTETEGQTTGSQNASTSASATSLVEGEGTTGNTKTTTGTDETEKTVAGTNSDKKTTKFSDTPQNNVDSINNYLTNYTEENTNGSLSNTENETHTSENTETDNGTSTSKTEGSDSSQSETNATDQRLTTGETDVSGTTRHTFTKKGNQGVNTYAHDMIEFRTSIRDITNEIITDHRIQNLFMLVW